MNGSFRRRLGALPLTLGLLLAGCAVGPDYVPPEPAVPDAWQQVLTRGLAEGQADLQTWWTLLDDPVLTSLIDRASDGNLDIRLAYARVNEARAQRGIARGDWFPSVDTVSSYQRSRISEGIFPIPVRTDPVNLLSAGFDASWEIDLFGRIRRSVESADAGLEASVEGYRDTLVVVLAEIGLTYVNVRTLQARIRFAEGNVRTQRGSLQITRDRNAAGLVGDLDVRQAELNLASTESTIPALRQVLIQSVNRLGVLLGEPPSALHAELATDAPIPKPPDEVLIGLPTELLRQRPDVRQTERELAAQNAQIGVAKADYYPRLSLLGTFAMEATDFVDWFSGDNISYGFGPAIRWNIFDGGRIRANVNVQETRTDQALLNYEQTVLFALEEAENSMVAFVQEQERRDALARSVVAAEKSVDLVGELYRIGLVDFNNVLDTERSLFQQQDRFAESEGLVSQNLVRIYKALGGGWSPPPTP